MNDAPEHPDPVLFAVVFEGGLGLVAVGLGWLLGDPPAQRIQWTPEGAVYGLFATFPLVAVVWACLRSGWRPLRGIMEVLEDKVVPLFRQCRVWELAGIAAFAGFGEELLFRGVIQNSLATLFSGEIGSCVGLVAASILFGLLHWLTLTYAILATSVGLYLGGLWLATDNLLVPALVHALYDFWALVYLLKVHRYRG
jgi:membrane protease YdiL (CAAX protease family)